MSTSITSQTKATVTPTQGAVWACGDSIGSGANMYIAQYPGTIVDAGHSGTGYIYAASWNTIANTYAAKLAAVGGVKPHTIVLGGGTNDKAPNGTGGDGALPYSDVAIQAAMLSFTRARINDGIRMVHFAEPWWTAGRNLTTYNAWLKATFPNVVACDTLLGGPSDNTYNADNIHPTPAGALIIANAIYAAVGP